MYETDRYIYPYWFETKEDLENYQVDPYHVSVVKKLMHEIREASIAIDYVE